MITSLLALALLPSSLLPSAVAWGLGPVASQETPSADDEKYRVKPVDEPAMPVSQDDAKKAGHLLMKGGGYIFNRDGVDGVAVPGTILMNRGVVELFACGVGGKEHESVVRIECDIQSLDFALTSCAFKRGDVPKKLSEKAEQGDRLIVLIQWRTKDDHVVTHRAEDLIVHIQRQSPMPRVGWTYVGGWVEVADPMSTPKEKKSYKILAAASSRSLMTTFRDASSLLDNPIPDAVDDTLYAANPIVAPAAGTSALVLLRKPTKAEIEEISKVEKELSK